MEFALLFISLAFVNALYIKGLFEATKPEKLLYRVSFLFERLLPALHPPLLGCLQCMASFHGSLFLLSAVLAGIVPYWYLFFAPFYVCVVSITTIFIDEMHLNLVEGRLCKNRN